jgi:predicted nucleotidyltransferase
MMEHFMNVPNLIVVAVRGSQLYGLALPTSDFDYHGIYVETPKEKATLFRRPEQIQDSKGDRLYYELRRYMELAMDAQTSALELLWTPADKLRLKTPVFDTLVRNRHLFVSTKAYWTHSGYAFAQIKKARGQNKKVHGYDKYVDELGIVTLRGWFAQGLISREWLGSRTCKDFADFVCRDDVFELQNDDLDRMDGVFSGNLFQQIDGYPKLLGPQPEQSMYVIRIKDTNPEVSYMPECHPVPAVGHPLLRHCKASKMEHVPDCWRLYYSPGCGSPIRNGEVVCSSIPIEDEQHIVGLLFYNLDAHAQARREYRQYWEWRLNRNDSRWQTQETGDADFDAKNMMHMCRLLLSGRHLLETGEPMVVFSGKEQLFLMDVRRGKYAFDWLLSFAEEQTAEMEALYNSCELPKEPDRKAIAALYTELLEEFAC